VVGCAHDGEQAVRMAGQLRPDVITMDLHMPGVDGYEATRRIMQTHPLPIVVVSGSEDPAEMDKSFRAIEAGALVLVQRPYGPGHPQHRESAAAVVRTVRAMAEVRVVRRWAASVTRRPARARRRLVLLGASTGGPAVLRDILAQLPRDFPLPLAIVQHMSPGFGGGLSDWLSKASGFPVALAAHGEPLNPGCAYLAPDGYHLGVDSALCAALASADPEHGMRPAVSYMFRSVSQELRAATVAVLLTGMGKDGADELRRLRDDGALTIVQDRASSAVWGMPGEALRKDAAMLVLTPPEIGKTLHAIANHPDAALPLAGYENNR